MTVGMVHGALWSRAGAIDVQLGCKFPGERHGRRKALCFLKVLRSTAAAADGDTYRSCVASFASERRGDIKTARVPWLEIHLMSQRSRYV